MPKIEFYTDTQGEWRWRIVAENGEIIGASSEGFASKRNASDNLDRLANALADLI